MKTLKKQLRPITWLLALVMLLQSCTVYKSTSITLDQAVQNESKVKVKTKSAENLKFKRIGVENGNYYGVKKSKGEMVRIPLNENFISSVKEKDKTLSTVLTVALPIAIIVGGLLIFQDSFKWKDSSFTIPLQL